MSYWDIDDILSEEEKVKSVFRTDAIGLGYLDHRGAGDDLKSGTAVELPFWVLKSLAQEGFVDLEYPRYLSERFRNSLLAEPTVANLAAKSPYFYEFGLKLAIFVNDAEALDMLSTSLASRFKEIISRSTHHRRDDHDLFMDKLAFMERKLLQLKMTSDDSFREWQQRRSSMLTSASLAGSKRKEMG